MPGITIAKAIEILSNSAYSGVTTFDQDFRDSEKLGVQAMIRFQTMRQDPGARGFWLLPGEAEE